MLIFPKLITRHQDRPIRQPCSSHPATLQIEQLLSASTKTIVAASKPSAQTICIGLSQLEELYKCISDVLNLSSTRDLISRHQNKKCFEKLVEESLSVLVVCGNTREMVRQFKEHVIDLQCALRRRKCENEIMKYNCFRKKIKKDVKLLTAGLKQVDNMVTSGELLAVVVDSADNQLAAVMQAVIGIGEMTVSVFESLLLYFSTPILKPNRWSSVVSKLIHRGKVACEDQKAHEITNEFESIDDGLQIFCETRSSTQGEKVQPANHHLCKLEKQEIQLDFMEARLQCIFRHLIRTRASLLNIISYKNLKAKSPSEILHSHQKF